MKTKQKKAEGDARVCVLVSKYGYAISCNTTFGICCWGTLEEAKRSVCKWLISDAMEVLKDIRRYGTQVWLEAIN